jgi:hypothetical protein
MDEDGRQSSAKLVGRLRMGPAPEGLLLLEGRWSQPDGPRSLLLAAQERRPTAAEARIATVKRLERDRLWKSIIPATYPEVRDAACADQRFNIDAPRFVETDVKRFKRAVIHLLAEEAERLSYELTSDVRHRRSDRQPPLPHLRLLRGPASRHRRERVRIRSRHREANEPRGPVPARIALLENPLGQARRRPPHHPAELLQLARGWSCAQ